jgi:hypothetical protein
MSEKLEEIWRTDYRNNSTWLNGFRMGFWEWDIWALGLYANPPVLPTGGLRKRGKFTCGKDISTPAVVGGVNEVTTYVHPHICFAHTINGSKLMIMLFELISTSQFLIFASEFLLLVTWIVVKGRHVAENNKFHYRLAVRPFGGFIELFTLYLHCNDWLRSSSRHTLSQKSLSIIIILFVLL